MTSEACPPVCRLPQELICMILTHLEPGELLAFSKTCGYLCRVAERQLYRNLRVCGAPRIMNGPDPNIELYKVLLKQKDLAHHVRSLSMNDDGWGDPDREEKAVGELSRDCRGRTKQLTHRVYGTEWFQEKALCPGVLSGLILALLPDLETLDLTMCNWEDSHWLRVFANLAEGRASPNSFRHLLRLELTMADGVAGEADKMGGGLGTDILGAFLTLPSLKDLQIEGASNELFLEDGRPRLASISRTSQLEEIELLSAKLSPEDIDGILSVTASTLTTFKLDWNGVRMLEYDMLPDVVSLVQSLYRAAETLTSVAVTWSDSAHYTDAGLFGVFKNMQGLTALETFAADKRLLLGKEAGHSTTTNPADFPTSLRTLAILRCGNADGAEFFDYVSSLLDAKARGELLSLTSIILYDLTVIWTLRQGSRPLQWRLPLGRKPKGTDWTPSSSRRRWGQLRHDMQLAGVALETLDGGGPFYDAEVDGDPYGLHDPPSASSSPVETCMDSTCCEVRDGYISPNAGRR